MPASNTRRSTLLRRSSAFAVSILLLVTGLAAMPTASAEPRDAVARAGRELWDRVPKPPVRTGGKRAEVRAETFRAFKLDRPQMKVALSQAPPERSSAAGLEVSLPAPDGGFERFLLQESPVMAPALAARYPEITTYRGVGIDDPAASIRADLTPLGFHASVRSPNGIWYVDPYYHLDQSVYATYFTRDLKEPRYTFVKREPVGGRQHGEADASAEAASLGLTTGTVLRTYRVALVSDPTYATYHGGPENVTAGKVTLMNRVTQIYEDETSIRLVLTANNDNANLDTPADATGTNGPCGAAACFTPAQVTSCGGSTLSRNRIVAGQLVGASNYDIGHIILGNPGGGIAALGVVGRNAKAQGCTGLPAPIGDYFAVDYVAHEMGHQFGGNHTFNGVQSACLGPNRNPTTSVEPGSGSSIMAYAGICDSDDLQPHSDPYWSQRSFEEITSYVTSSQAVISEVQNASLRAFDTNGDSFEIRYEGNDSVPILRGTNYTAAGIQSAIQGIPGWPSGATVTVTGFAGGTFNDTGFQVTFGGTLANVNASQLELVDFSGADGFVGETAKGGVVDNQGHTVTPTGNSPPTVSGPTQVTIPIRTPFTLTGSANDPDGDTVTYLWEQNDAGGAGTPLMSNAKTDGPLFRMFGTALQEPPYVETQYNADGENHPTTDPTRVFPDLAQILANRTNATIGLCPDGDAECFSEFLPNADYVGFADENGDPPSLNFRLTARDGRGGVASQDTNLVLAKTAGPFLMTAPNMAVAWKGGETRTVTWDPARTQLPPVSTANVKISLSLDGGFTYPHVLASSTPNDGSQTVTVPFVSTSDARIKVEAVDNVFFDISDADFQISTVTVSIDDATTREGTARKSRASFSVRLSEASTAPVTLHVETADGTATAPADYRAVSTDISIPAGVTSRLVHVDLVADTAAEDDESFFVNLSSATNALIGDGQAVGTILDDDSSTPPPTTPEITVSDATATEGADGTVAAARFRVFLSEPSTSAVTVTWSTADGTATAGADYRAQPATTLTFSAGQTSKTVAVKVFGDSVPEPNETFFVNLSSPTNATVADGQGVGTITNDD